MFRCVIKFKAFRKQKRPKKKIEEKWRYFECE